MDVQGTDRLGLEVSHAPDLIVLPDSGPQPGPRGQGGPPSSARAGRRPDRVPRRVRLGLSLITVLALLVASVAVLQGTRAVDRAGAAQGQGRAAALAAQSRALLATDPRMALALAAQAVAATSPSTPVAEAALVDARSAVAEPAWQQVRPARGTSPGGSDAVAFHPGGNLLAIAGGAPDGGGVVRLWDLTTDEVIAQVDTGRAGPEAAVAFSPDGALLVTGGPGGDVRMIDVARGAVVGPPLSGAEGSIEALAFSRDGALLAVATTTPAGQGQVQMWDPVTRRAVGAPLQGTAAVPCLEFSPRADVLAVCGRDAAGEGAVTLRQARTGEQVGPALHGHFGAVGTVAISRDGSLVATGGDDGTVQVWRAGTGQPVGLPLPVDEDRVTAIDFSPTEDLVATAGAQGALQLWDARSGEPIGQPLDVGQDELTAVAFAPTGDVLAAASRDGRVQLWEAGAGDPAGQPLPGHPVGEALPGHAGGVAALALAESGSVLVTAGVDEDDAQGVLQAWDPGTGEATGPLQEVGSGWAPAVSPDGATLATSGRVVNGEGSVQLRRAGTGEPVGEPLAGFDGPVTALAFSPDGSQLVTASRDIAALSTIQAWDLASREPVGPAATVAGTLSDLAMTPDGARIVAVVTSQEAAVGIWDRASMRPEAPAPAPADVDEAAVAVRPGDGLLATGGADGVVRLWDPSRGLAPAPPLPTLGAPVLDLAFSPDAQTLAAVAADGSAHLWDTRSWASRGSVAAAGPLTAVAVGADGRVLTGGADGVVRLWDAWQWQAACPLVRPGVDRAELERLAAAAWPGGHDVDLACW